MSLPDIGIPRIKAKVDTGARTSALHAFYTERFRKSGRDWVRFHVHPMQGSTSYVVKCELPLLDERWVSDSGGHRERRFVVTTTLVVGQLSTRIEMTLTNRDTMRFRMLLGRSAMGNHFVVDPHSSYLMGKPS